MTLMQVIKGKILHLPLDVDSDGRLWLREGGVLDFSDPYFPHACRGQEYKLEPARPGARPNPIEHRVMQTRHEQFHGRLSKAEPTATQRRATLGEERAASTNNIIDGIEVPDLSGSVKA